MKKRQQGRLGAALLAIIWGLGLSAQGSVGTDSTQDSGGISSSKASGGDAGSQEASDKGGKNLDGSDQLSLLSSSNPEGGEAADSDSNLSSLLSAVSPHGLRYAGPDRADLTQRALRAPKNLVADTADASQEIQALLKKVYTAFNGVFLDRDVPAKFAPAVKKEKQKWNGIVSKKIKLFIEKGQSLLKKTIPDASMDGGARVLEEKELYEGLVAELVLSLENDANLLYTQLENKMGREKKARDEDPQLFAELFILDGLCRYIKDINEHSNLPWSDQNPLYQAFQKMKGTQGWGRQEAEKDLSQPLLPIIEEARLRFLESADLPLHFQLGVQQEKKYWHTRLDNILARLMNEYYKKVQSNQNKRADLIKETPNSWSLIATQRWLDQQNQIAAERVTDQLAIEVIEMAVRRYKPLLSNARDVSQKIQNKDPEIFQAIFVLADLYDFLRGVNLSSVQDAKDNDFFQRLFAFMGSNEKNFADAQEIDDKVKDLWSAFQEASLGGPEETNGQTPLDPATQTMDQSLFQIDGKDPLDGGPKKRRRGKSKSYGTAPSLRVPGKRALSQDMGLMTNEDDTPSWFRMGLSENKSRRGVGDRRGGRDQAAGQNGVEGFSLDDHKAFSPRLQGDKESQNSTLNTKRWKGRPVIKHLSLHQNPLGSAVESAVTDPSMGTQSTFATLGTDGTDRSNRKAGDSWLDEKSSAKGVQGFSGDHGLIAQTQEDEDLLIDNIQFDEDRIAQLDRELEEKDAQKQGYPGITGGNKARRRNYMQGPKKDLSIIIEEDLGNSMLSSVNPDGGGGLYDSRGSLSKTTDAIVNNSNGALPSEELLSYILSDDQLMDDNKSAQEEKSGTISRKSLLQDEGESLGWSELEDDVRSHRMSDDQLMGDNKSAQEERSVTISRTSLLQDEGESLSNLDPSAGLSSVSGVSNQTQIPGVQENRMAPKKAFDYVRKNRASQLSQRTTPVSQVSEDLIVQPNGKRGTGTQRPVSFEGRNRSASGSWQGAGSSFTHLLEPAQLDSPIQGANNSMTRRLPKDTLLAGETPLSKGPGQHRRIRSDLVGSTDAGGFYPGTSYPRNAYPRNAYPRNAYPRNAYPGTAHVGPFYIERSSSKSPYISAPYVKSVYAEPAGAGQDVQNWPGTTKGAGFKTLDSLPRSAPQSKPVVAGSRKPIHETGPAFDVQPRRLVPKHISALVPRSLSNSSSESEDSAGRAIQDFRRPGFFRDFKGYNTLTGPMETKGGAQPRMRIDGPGAGSSRPFTSAFLNKVKGGQEVKSGQEMSALNDRTGGLGYDHLRDKRDLNRGVLFNPSLDAAPLTKLGGTQKIKSRQDHSVLRRGGTLPYDPLRDKWQPLR